jgi:carbon monoxide dehydrogenase subunit G
MQLENQFAVDLPPAEAWDVLLNIERIAPCMPGAELTEIVDDRTFRGRVSVRLGPVALSFDGTAVFEEVDNRGQRARVKAEGADSKGRGGAAATVVFRIEPAGAGSRVIVETDLNLSGSVAQYGRGVGLIQNIAGQLISQFSDNLQAELARTDASLETAGPAPPPAAKPVPLIALFGKALKDWLVRIFGRA